MPRHAVDQGDKFRPVDNGSYPRGLHNMAYSPREVVGLMTADYTTGVARAFFDSYRARAEPRPEIAVSRDDEPNAYRNVPTAEPESHVEIDITQNPENQWFSSCAATPLVSAHDFATPETKRSRGFTAEVRLRVKPETKSRALAMIAACRTANSISPAVAGKLRGLLRVRNRP